MQVEPLKLRKPKRVCIKCKRFFKRRGNVGVCEKYGFEINVELAKKAKVCEDFELHHAMPLGNLVPTSKTRGETEK